MPRQDGNLYRAVFTNPVGRVVSAAAPLTVDYAPIIRLQPVSHLTRVGDEVTLQVAASADPALIVQWQVSTDGQTFTDIVGANFSEYTFVASALGKTYYRAELTNTLGTTVSDVAAVTAYDAMS
jgi:hypothetical protein